MHPKQILPMDIGLALVLAVCSRRTAAPGVSVLPSGEDCYTQRTLSVSGGNLNYSDSKKSLAASYQLFLDKEEACYFQASVLFIEAARGLVTRDSFFLLNRLERTCMQGALADVERSFGIKASPKMLFTLFSGNFCPDAFAEAGLRPVVSTNDLVRYTSPMQYQVTVARRAGSNNMEQLLITDQRGSTVIQADFSSFHAVDGGEVPAQIRITQPEQHREIGIRCNNFAFGTQKEINFAVPANYKRVRLTFE